MNYKESLDYINTIQMRLGSDYSLREVTELCERVGRPDQKIKIIHLAGTNGKGSVGMYLTDILSEAGYSVGRYLSPTILDYRERIQNIPSKNDENKVSLKPDKQFQEEFDFQDKRNKMMSYFVSEEEVAQKITILKEECEKMVKQGFHQPTAFEIETVMAFMLFADWKVDIAIVETGLGGTLDATNFIQNPLLCIITSISKDHMGILGDTIEKIALQKYGIIKENTTVISAKQDPCYALLKEVCQKKNAKLCIVEKEKYQLEKIEWNNNQFIYDTKRYVLAQNGIYQIENALLAILATKQLIQMGFSNINDQKTRQALSQSFWYGRFETICNRPFILMDGAHNQDGAKRLYESLTTYFPKEKFCFITGMYKDKEYQKVLDIMLPLADRIYTVSTEGKRSLDAKELKNVAQTILKQQNSDVLVMDSAGIEDAIEKAMQTANKKRIVIFGTLSYMQKIYRFFENKK